MRSVIRVRLGDHLAGFSARQEFREAERAAKLPVNRERSRQYLLEARAGTPPKKSPVFKQAHE